jgi:hypothetical protein
MIRFFANWLFRSFWASANSSVYDLIFESSDWCFERGSHALDPGFPLEQPGADPATRPVRPLPTDVPAPEPRDVPVREPRDVPPPKQGGVPNTTKPGNPSEKKPRPAP